MKLADLVDLEWLLRPDREQQSADLPPPAEAERLGRRIAEELGMAPGEARARLDADRSFRAAFCRRWLQAVRQQRSDLPGSRVEGALRLLGWVLVAAGVLLGIGAARTLLAYDGSTPVNVLHFCGVFFGLQILLLLAMVWFVLRSGRGRSGPGFLHQPLALLAGWLLRKRGADTLAALQSLRSRAALYRDVERWTLFAIAQRLGVAFNAAALATALATIAFSDLVFAWSTTLDLAAADVHEAVRALALPFSFWEAAVPSLEVVRASQWDRMQGAFVGGRSLAEAIPLAAQWWRFLIAGLIAWGLLPRLLALAFGSLRAARARARAALDHAGFQALYDRLLPPAVGWQGPAPESVRGGQPRPLRESGPPPSAAPGTPTWLVLWGSLARARSAVVEHLRARLGAEIRAVLTAGGAELAGDEATLSALRQQNAGRVVLVMHAGQQPTAEVLGFLAGLRGTLGAGKPVLVALVEPGPEGCGGAAPDELAAWRRSLAAIDDPHLWLAAAEEAR